MCYEICGPDSGSPEDLAAYDEWLASLRDAPEVAEEDDDDEVQVISEAESYNRYDEMLDEVCGIVTIGMLTYNPSRVLKSVDPIAYSTGYNDWLDMELTEGSFKIED